MRQLVMAALAVGVSFGIVTLVALEGREVVVLETTDASGGPRRTRAWIADDAGSVWVEAATPERPFVSDLQRRPGLVLERGGTRRTCVAEVATNPEGHEHVRRLLAEHYGWADCWVGLIADTSGSLGIRLSCA